MKDNSEINGKVHELQILEQSLHNFMAQKQAFQLEDGEIENALRELKKTTEEAYKIISGIMIKTDKQTLIKELEDKKKIISFRLSSIEKQEKILEEKSSKLREEMSEFMEKSEN